MVSDIEVGVESRYVNGKSKTTHTYTILIISQSKSVKGHRTSSLH